MTEISSIPRLYTPEETAALLSSATCKISVFTVTRLRRAKKLGCKRIGRKIFFTEQHIKAYLDSVDEAPKECPEKNSQTPNESGKSATSGYQKSPVPKIGAEPGTTKKSDKQSAAQLARQILKKQPNDSQNGTSTRES
jgi:hypothetical protein